MSQYVICAPATTGLYECAVCHEPIAMDPVTSAQGKIGVCPPCAGEARRSEAAGEAPEAPELDDDGDDFWDDD